MNSNVSLHLKEKHTFTLYIEIRDGRAGSEPEPESERAGFFEELEPEPRAK